MTSIESKPSTRAGAAVVRWFAQIDRNAVADVGGKGANLGEISRAGLPVPNGFVVTVRAYDTFIQANELAPRIESIVSRIDVDEPASLESAARALRELIVGADLPVETRDAIVNAYRRLSARENSDGDLAVAVRSSAPSEDGAEASFAGMFESFLGVRGAGDVVDRVRDCWASTFAERVLFYRVKQRQSAVHSVAVVVQCMVASDKAGVMFTVDPTHAERDRMLIECAWGLGEAVVSGHVTPDRYTIDRESLDVSDATVARKEFMLVLSPNGGKPKRVDLAQQPHATSRVLDDRELRALAELGKRAETHYGTPQDMEFAIAGDSIFIVQTRPITTLEKNPTIAPEDGVTPSGRVLLRGSGASPGIVSGVVRVLTKPSESSALQAGEILVAPMTTPDWVPAMRRAAALVTDAGGMTSHAAIVSRELGIPCVVGTREATKILANGAIVTVDGRGGTVAEGRAPESATESAPEQKKHAPAPARIITATKLYVNLAEPEIADEVALADVDGVGLLRAEFMLLSALENVHPRRFLEEKRGDELVERMKEKLLVFARAFHPRPIIYRATDFRSNEYRGLTGGDRYEPQEENPMIGYRGCFRYTREPELFGLELQALYDVRKEFDNINLMIPFVRTKRELAACIALIDRSPLGADANMQRWVMAEVPSVVYWLPEYAKLGITGVSIGSNDLTQLVLGVDRDSEIVAPLYDERDPAVLHAIESIIRTCRAVGITCSICGQAPSVHPDFAAALVRWGIDSISVNRDSIDRTRRNIAMAEQKILLERARG